jgi:chitinase
MHYNWLNLDTSFLQNMLMPRRLPALFAFILFVSSSLIGSVSPAQGPAPRIQETTGPAVIGYYAGRNSEIDSFATGKLTHIIFSFCHLKGNALSVDNAGDSAIIRHMVSLKKGNPRLKVILSLGGWGGCKTCPDVFATKEGRMEFTHSVRELTNWFHTDGIDLDWEYPALSNVPGYPFYPADKDHFTSLISLLREELGKGPEISFAAGGFTQYLETSIDWKKVEPNVNYINLMTYDLINGYSTVTGHHTPLYSTPEQLESTDHAVRFLDSIGVPLHKIAIGVAFYGRVFENVDSINDGLYRSGKFKNGISYKDQAAILTKENGYAFHWDPIAKAPYMYNASQKLFVTYDDTLSIRLKTRYVLEKHLGGIMFWQLPEDRFRNGLLDVIDKARKEGL